MVRQFSLIFPAKISQKPFKNDIQTMKGSMPNRVGLFNGFNQVLASILESLGPPSWSQVGPKMRAIIGTNPFGSQLVMTGRFGEGLGRVWGGFGEGLGWFGDRLARVWGGFWPPSWS